MYVLPFMFFELVISIFVLGVSLGVLALFYSKTLHRLHLLEKQNDELKAHSVEKAEHLVEKARLKAHDMVENANEKAEEVLNETLLFNQDSRETFDKELSVVTKSQAQELEEVSREMISLYKSMIAQVKNDTVKVFQNASKDIETESISQLNNFKEVLERETVTAQKVIEQKIDQEYQQVKQEVAEYKKKQLAQVDESINSLLKQVSEQVLGQALTPNDHQKLVLDTLAKAKENF